MIEIYSFENGYFGFPEGSVIVGPVFNGYRRYLKIEAPKNESILTGIGILADTNSRLFLVIQLNAAQLLLF